MYALFLHNRIQLKADRLTLKQRKTSINGCFLFFLSRKSLFVAQKQVGTPLALTKAHSFHTHHNPSRYKPHTQPSNINTHHTPVLRRTDAEGTHPSAFVFVKTNAST
jgi:hypothetical protein